MRLLRSGRRKFDFAALDQQMQGRQAGGSKQATLALLAAIVPKELA